MPKRSFVAAGPNLPEVTPSLAGWELTSIYVNALQHYIPVDCFLVPFNRADRWMMIHRTVREWSFADLAYWVTTPEKRDAHYRRGLDKVRRSKKPAIASLGAFCDLFVPVMDSGKVVGALVVGPFVDHVPSLGELRTSWLSVAGEHDAAFGDDFRQYCRILLEAPVLEGEVLDEFVEFTVLFARSMRPGGDADRMRERMETIFYGTLCPSFYHATWADRVIHQNQYLQKAWREGHVAGWETRELGLARVPRQVLACMVSAGVDAGSLDALILQKQFQQVMLEFATSRDDLAAGKVGDDVVAVFFAPQAGREHTAKRLVSDLKAYVRGKLNKELLCGVGDTSESGRLHQSYRQAWDSLHRLVGGTPANPAGQEWSGMDAVVESGRRLMKALPGSNAQALRLARSQFVNAAGLAGRGSVEALRAMYLRFSKDLLESLVGEFRMETATAEKLGAYWDARLELAAGTHELTRVFSSLLDETKTGLESPSKEDRFLRFSKARRWVEDHFRKDPSLREVAKNFGFSSSGFARELKRELGLSYSEWIDRLRLSQAKELLEGTRLSASAVATASGFDSTSYFFQWFKRHSGQTPLQWRRRRIKASK